MEEGSGNECCAVLQLLAGVTSLPALLHVGVYMPPTHILFVSLSCSFLEDHTPAAPHSLCTLAEAAALGSAYKSSAQISV